MCVIMHVYACMHVPGARDDSIITPHVFHVCVRIMCLQCICMCVCVSALGHICDVCAVMHVWSIP